MDAGFKEQAEQMDLRFTEQKAEQQRFAEQADARFTEQKAEQQRFADQVDARFTEQKAEQSRLEAKMDTHFTKLYGRVGWIWGATAVIGAALGTIATLLLKS